MSQKKDESGSDKLTSTQLMGEDETEVEKTKPTQLDQSEVVSTEKISLGTQGQDTIKAKQRKGRGNLKVICKKFDLHLSIILG